jgi:hypothetical protein
MAIQKQVDSLDSVPDFLRESYIPLDAANPNGPQVLVLDDPNDNADVKHYKSKVHEFRATNTLLMNQVAEKNKALEEYQKKMDEGRLQHPQQHLLGLRQLLLQAPR